MGRGHCGESQKVPSFTKEIKMHLLALTLQEIIQVSVHTHTHTREDKNLPDDEIKITKALNTITNQLYLDKCCTVKIKFSFA